MNSRERILAALNHQEPDRVPVDLSGYRSSGISAIAYTKLRPRWAWSRGRSASTIRSSNWPSWMTMCWIGRAPTPLSWAADSPGGALVGGLDACGRHPLQDARLGSAGAPRQRLGLPQSGRRVMARMPEGALHFDQTWWPFLDGEETWGGSKSCTPSTCGRGSRRLRGGCGHLDELAEGARRLRARKDRAIVGLFGGNLLEMGQFYYRMDRFLMLLAAEPARAHRFLDALVEIHLRNLGGTWARWAA